MKSTFSIIFYLKRQMVKKDGTVPVMGRITVDGTQAQFSCKLTANPNLWDTKGGRMTGKSMLALEVNRKLDKMRVSISKYYQEILDRDNFVTAEKVKNAFLGLEYRCHTLMKVYAQAKDEVEKQYKAGMNSLGTFKKFRIGYAYVGEFTQSHYNLKNLKDIALKELSLSFITDYETFLRTDKHLKINSAMVLVRNLRVMIFRAIDREWLVKDPFRRYEYKYEETTREILTKEEIHLLMETPISSKKMSLVRDLFLFCCFTGLAFIDLYNLKEENIKEFFDGGEWIVIQRQKTGTEANIKLLDYPKQIMEKYRGLCEDDRVFPVPIYKSRRDTEDWTNDIVQSEGEVWNRIGFCEGKSEEWGVQNMNTCSRFEHFLFLYCSAVVAVVLLIIRKLYSILALPDVYWIAFGLLGVVCTPPNRSLTIKIERLMSHNILTETAFFKVINNLGGKMEMEQILVEYHQFVTQVIDLYHRTSESKEALHALVFAGTELQYHPLLHPDTGCVLGLYIKKALSFIRKMMLQVKANAGKGASIAIAHVKTGKALPICWTGNAVDLVEMVYGICVMESVNDGEVKFKELAQAMYQFFGVKAKDCYRFYTDIRRRKNYSRTYFLDRMQEKLNDKMRRDDELERMRR